MLVSCAFAGCCARAGTGRAMAAASAAARARLRGWVMARLLSRRHSGRMRTQPRGRRITDRLQIRVLEALGGEVEAGARLVPARGVGQALGLGGAGEHEAVAQA